MPQNDDPLFIDFHGTKVSQLIVNDAVQEGKTEEYFKDGMIILKNGQIQMGQNTVKVSFLNDYRNDGIGFHSFIDQVDNQQYLYTNLEPNYCHYVFPVFDQPDIKAKWTLKTVIPNDWSVISNQLENKQNGNTTLQLSSITEQLSQVAKLSGKESLTQSQDTKVVVFQQTPTISPYLYAIVAGPYTYVERLTSGYVPMRVYYRKSIEGSVDPAVFEEMFVVTQTGMRWYADLFGMPF